MGSSKTRSRLIAGASGVIGASLILLSISRPLGRPFDKYELRAALSRRLAAEHARDTEHNGGEKWGIQTILHPDLHPSNLAIIF